MNDKQLFVTSMKELQAHIKVDGISLYAWSDHLYQRSKQRNVDWIDIHKAMQKFFKEHLCELLFQLHVTPVSTVTHDTGDFSLVLGLYENNIVLRTVFSKNMSNKSTKEKKITFI